MSELNLDMRSTYSNKLTVVDVSGMLYTYTCVADKMKFKGSSHIGGVNVAGVKSIIDLCSMRYMQRRRVVLCLDSYSDKKRDSKQYKANRKYPPQIDVQTEIISTYFKNFGVDVLQRDGLEADDLIYSTVLCNKDKFSSIEVITGDKDIYGCMVAPNISIIGVNSVTPSFDISAYESCVLKNREMPYNCILPYLVLFGKESNNLHKLRLGGMNDEYFDKYVEYVRSKGDMSLGSDLGTWIEFLETGIINKDYLDDIVEQSLLVFPKIVNINIELQAPAIDPIKLVQFLSYFRMNEAAKGYGLLGSLNSAEIDRGMKTLMKRLYSTVTDGVKYADAGLMPEANTLNYKTDEFLGVEDW